MTDFAIEVNVVALGEAYLRRILTKISAFYNELRTHRSLDKDAPIHRAIQPSYLRPSSADFITIIAESDFRYRQRRTCHPSRLAVAHLSLKLSRLS